MHNSEKLFFLDYAFFRQITRFSPHLSAQITWKVIARTFQTTHGLCTEDQHAAFECVLIALILTETERGNSLLREKETRKYILGDLVDYKKRS